MTYSPLTKSALPLTITVGGEAFPIRTDFRAGIEFEQIVADATIPDGTRAVLALDCWFPDGWPACDLRELIEAVMEFYRCGKPESKTTSQRLYDFGHDWDAIYSAFLAAYRLDLLDAEYLHWWRFRAMLQDLPAESTFARAVGYRGAKPSKGMSDEQKKHLREMQRLYALPRDEEVAGFRTEDDFRAHLAEQRELARVAADRMGEGDAPASDGSGRAAEPE